MNYANVKGGVVVYIGHLPKSYANVSGFDQITDPNILKNHGWFPMEEVKVPYDNQTHYLVSPSVAIEADKVVVTDVVIAFTTDQIKQNNWNDWITGMANSDDLYSISSDIQLPRGMEDIMDALIERDSTAFDNYAKLKKSNSDKKALRATKPTNPNE
jgi:hypothetical protein